jgi:hypothetical protein
MIIKIKWLNITEICENVKPTPGLKARCMTGVYTSYFHKTFQRLCHASDDGLIRPKLIMRTHYNTNCTGGNTIYTGQFKKKVTISHVYNEVTSELTIKQYIILRKTL